MNRRSSTTGRDVSKVAALLLTITLVVAILYWAKVVLLPVALAVMVTFILSPLVTRLDRWGMNRISAVLTVVALAGALSTTMILLVTWQLYSLANDLPNYRQNIAGKLAVIKQGSQNSTLEKIRSTIAVAAEGTPSEQSVATDPQAESLPSQQTPLPVSVVATSSPEASFYAMIGSLAAMSPFLEALATAGLSMILLIFMLIRREDLRNRLVSLSTEGSLTTMTRALDDAGRRISRYLLMQLIINGTFGLAIAFGLLIIGVPYAPLWGLCAAVLRYIPYIGPWVAALLPLTVSLITSPGWTQVLLVFALFLVLELVSNNIMEPWLYGQGIGISEVALLVSAAFWTWIWGPVGLVLATPLTVCLAVTGKYVPALAFLDRLLGDRAALRPHTALLQRLMAKDDDEATKIVREYRADHPPATVYDAVLIPALRLARLDRERGVMDAAEEAFVLQATRGILADISPDKINPVLTGEQKSLSADATTTRHHPPSGIGGWHLLRALVSRMQRPHDESGRVPSPSIEVRQTEQLSTTEVPASSVIRVLGCAAHKEVEELTLQMLDHLIAPAGVRIDILSTRTLSSEIVERVEREKPTVVIIAALPPGGLRQAHYLCKLLRKQFPQLGIVVGTWGEQGSLDRTILKFRSAGAHYISTTLMGAKDHVVALSRSAPRDSSLVIPREDQEGPDSKSLTERQLSTLGQVAQPREQDTSARGTATPQTAARGLGEGPTNGN